jgi:hypothetical protein
VSREVDAKHLGAIVESSLKLLSDADRLFAKTEQLSAGKIVETSFMYWNAKVLLTGGNICIVALSHYSSAVEFGIFSVLAKDAKTLEEVVVATGTASKRGMMDLLV